MMRWILFSLIVFMCSAAKGKRAKADPNDNRGNTPFFLQDPNDETCLGPEGFSVCDEQASKRKQKRNG